MTQLYVFLGIAYDGAQVKFLKRVPSSLTVLSYLVHKLSQYLLLLFDKYPRISLVKIQANSRVLTKDEIKQNVIVSGVSHGSTS